MRLAAAALAPSMIVLSCAQMHTTPPPALAHDAASYREARAELLRARARLAPTSPTSFRVRAAFSQATAGLSLSARGAYAVRPPQALRMQLVGPAAGLALDVWVDGPRSRMHIPAIERVERADRDEDLGPGRPAAFLRWALLSPLAGTLVVAMRDDAHRGFRYVIKAPDGARIEALVERGARHVELTRFSRRDTEHLVIDDGPCGVARYRSDSALLDVEVRCEGPGGAPSPRAFDDPDAPASP